MFVVAVHTPIVGLSIARLALGWPMLLMPVHIVFLQLIIDRPILWFSRPNRLKPMPCMASQPRSSKMRRFDVGVLARGLAQGGVLLGLYVLVRSQTGSDDLARAMTFAVLVLSNLGLIQANRNWSCPSWRRASLENPYFGWIAVVALATEVGVRLTRNILRVSLSAFRIGTRCSHRGNGFFAGAPSMDVLICAIPNVQRMLQ